MNQLNVYHLRLKFASGTHVITYAYTLYVQNEERTVATDTFDAIQLYNSYKELIEGHRQTNKVIDYGQQRDHEMNYYFLQCMTFIARHQTASVYFDRYLIEKAHLLSIGQSVMMLQVEKQFV